MTETRLTAEDLARLRAIAEAATKGEWRHYSTGSYVMADTTKVCQLQDPWIRNDNQRADAAHIAAFNPQTALALLDQVDALERALQEVIAQLVWCEAPRANDRESVEYAVRLARAALTPSETKGDPQ